jgi:CubicO group peptidase (beta-lactamase class C family)
MLVMVDGEILFEDYPNGGSTDRAHELASGTKSFSGTIAVLAVMDGLIKLDDKVCETITEWKDDERKAKVTIRQLLGLISGIEPKNRGTQRVPSYADAIKIPFKDEPGEKFNYGPVPFTVFGELMRRKLDGKSPLDYLDEKVFKKIGLEYGRWRKDADGNPHIPSGAALTARNWAKYGELVRLGGKWKNEQILDPKTLDECFKGSEPNPAYGLTWWLNREVDAEKRRNIRQLQRNDMRDRGGIPDDLVFAAGAGKQMLYISRELKLVAVRQGSGIQGSLRGERPTFSDIEFLSRILRGEDADGNPAKPVEKKKEEKNEAELRPDRRERRRQDHRGGARRRDEPPARAVISRLIRSRSCRTAGPSRGLCRPAPPRRPPREAWTRPPTPSPAARPPSCTAGSA